MIEIELPAWLPAEDDGFHSVADLDTIVANELTAAHLETDTFVDGLYLGMVTHYPLGVAVMLHVWLLTLTNKIVSLARYEELDKLMDGIPVGSHCRVSHMRLKHIKHGSVYPGRWKFFVSWREGNAIARDDVDRDADLPEEAPDPPGLSPVQDRLAPGDVVHHMDCDDSPD